MIELLGSPVYSSILSEGQKSRSCLSLPTKGTETQPLCLIYVSILYKILEIVTSRSPLRLKKKFETVFSLSHLAFVNFTQSHLGLVLI